MTVAIKKGISHQPEPYGHNSYPFMILGITIAPFGASVKQARYQARSLYA